MELRERLCLNRHCVYSGTLVTRVGGDPTIVPELMADQKASVGDIVDTADCK